MGSRPVHNTEAITNELDKHLPALFHHREDEKDSKEQAQNEQAQVLALFERLGVKSYNAQTTGGTVTGTWGQGSSSTLDVDMLKSRIGAAAFNKLTTKQLDKKLLKEAIAKKEVDPAIVAACTRTEPTAAYIRTQFTPVKSAKTKNGDTADD